MFSIVGQKCNKSTAQDKNLAAYPWPFTNSLSIYETTAEWISKGGQLFTLGEASMSRVLFWELTPPVRARRGAQPRNAFPCLQHQFKKWNKTKKQTNEQKPHNPPDNQKCFPKGKWTSWDRTYCSRKKEGINTERALLLKSILPNCFSIRQKLDFALLSHWWAVPPASKCSGLREAVLTNTIPQIIYQLADRLCSTELS